MKNERITPEEIHQHLFWKAVAKLATAKARELEMPIRSKFAEINLKATDVGVFKITTGTSSVDWDPDIIETIKNIEGVSEADKAKLFHPPVRKGNGTHLNSIAKKYGGPVADRILEAREESGQTFKIDTNRVERHKIDQEAESFLEEQQEEENNE